MQAHPRFIAPKACAIVVLVCAALDSTAARADPPTPRAVPPAPRGPASPLRLPAFLALGVGGLTASGAVVAGVASSSSHAEAKLDCGSHCGAPTDRTLSTTSKILTGVAAASVGVGLVLLLTAPRKEGPSFTPSLGVGVSATKATAKAIWTF